MTNTYRLQVAGRSFVYCKKNEKIECAEKWMVKKFNCLKWLGNFFFTHRKITKMCATKKDWEREQVEV